MIARQVGFLYPEINILCSRIAVFFFSFSIICSDGLTFILQVFSNCVKISSELLFVCSCGCYQCLETRASMKRDENAKALKTRNLTHWHV